MNTYIYKTVWWFIPMTACIYPIAVGNYQYNSQNCNNYSKYSQTQSRKFLVGKERSFL